jgi:uncharacterized membrane protein YbaN (DUF454 family)
MPDPDRLHRSRPIRFLLWSAGFLSLVLAAIGIVLPGLPTTPFVLLAAACFVRASPRTHAWLLRNPTFGPMLSMWEQHRSIPRRVQRIGLAGMALMAAFSVWYFDGRPWLQGSVLLGVGIGGESHHPVSQRVHDIQMVFQGLARRGHEPTGEFALINVQHRGTRRGLLQWLGQSRRTGAEPHPVQAVFFFAQRFGRLPGRGSQ